ILKAGSAYVPLDPAYPRERLAFVLGDASPVVVLTQEALAPRIPVVNAELIRLDSDWPIIAQQPSVNPGLRPQGMTSSGVAYVIYTSGSTGAPKGVMVEHRNVVRLFRATEELFRFDERDVWTLFHSFAFDFSVWELWGALLYGGRLVIVPYLISRSPDEFYRLLCDERVTILNQTPSAFSQVAAVQGRGSGESNSIRAIIFGGEPLEFRMLKPWVERNGTERPRLVNMYGITETTVHVTFRVIAREDVYSESGSNIGKPIADLRIYLLDTRLRPVPMGVPGEIYVGGAGVARGYLNRDDLTSARFLVDPFQGQGHERMYKSGDIGRWCSDGTIEFLGRNDDQVKIRGFRVELGEIAARLMEHPAVEQAAVVARADSNGEKRLIGYITARNRPSAPSPED